MIEGNYVEAVVYWVAGEASTGMARSPWKTG
jgi:hypothetical protein